MRQQEKPILLKCSRKENAPGKRLILLTFQKQYEEPSTAMAPVSLKRTDDFLTPLQIAGFFFSLDREKTYSTSSEDIERHEANKKKDIQELTEEVKSTTATK